MKNLEAFKFGIERQRQRDRDLETDNVKDRRGAEVRGEGKRSEETELQKCEDTQTQMLM